MTPLNVTGTEQSCGAGDSIDMSLTVAVAEIMECLIEKSEPIMTRKFDHCCVSFCTFLSALEFRQRN